MTATSNIPSNKNFLSQLGFIFSIKKLPHVNYFVQTVTLPQISLGQSDIQTPFVKLPIPGDHVTFNELAIGFRVDEMMKNYKEIFDWIIALGFPDNFDQYKNISPLTKNQLRNTMVSGTGVYSDASLIILNSLKTPFIEFQFKNLYPVTLSEIQLDTQLSDVEYIQASVTFAYQTFQLNYL